MSLGLPAASAVTFGTPLTVVNEKLDRIIARLEAEESKGEEMSGHARQRGKKASGMPSLTYPRAASETADGLS
jgi:hypothetical protein